MTNEEILNKHWIELNKKESDPEMHLYLSAEEIDMICAAMDEANKQEAIGFNEWVESNRFIKHRNRWYDTKHDGESWGSFPSYTKEQLYELYELYIKSKQP